MKAHRLIVLRFIGQFHTNGEFCAGNEAGLRCDNSFDRDVGAPFFGEDLVRDDRNVLVFPGLFLKNDILFPFCFLHIGKDVHLLGENRGCPDQGDRKVAPYTLRFGEER